MSRIFDDWKDGPDNLIPSNIYFTHRVDEPVKLRYLGDDAYKYPPISLYTFMKKTCIVNPKHLAHVTIKNNQIIETLTYQDYWNHTILVAKSLIKLGIGLNTCVSIYAKNSSKWLIIELGTIFAGGVIVGHSKSPSLESIEFVLKNSGSSIVFVENNENLENLLKIKSIELKWIIQMNDEINEKYKQFKNIIDWKQFIDNSAQITDDIFNERIKLMAPNKCIILCYTSGTTDKPKACMLSHDNLIFPALRLCPSTIYKGRIISNYQSYNVAGQYINLFMPIGFGATVYFTDFDSDKDLIENIKIVKPNFICGVPSIYNLYKSLMTDDLNSLKNIDHKTKVEFIKSKYGLDQCISFSCGGAAIDDETLEFFKNLEIIILLFYGSSESIGHIASKYPENDLNCLGKISEPRPIKLGSNREILIYGRNLFMGYLNCEQRNLASFDSNNWFHTGDMGRIDEKGQLFYIGRIKEIIKTVDSNIIAPKWIEEAIKKEMNGLISNCIIIGESKPFLSALLMFKCKVDEKTSEPLDELEPNVIKFLNSFGLNVTKQSEFANLSLPDILFNWIKEKIEIATKKSELYVTIATEYINIEKFVILNRDLSKKHGELTEMMKICRYKIAENFKDYIEKLYVKD